MKIPTLVFRLLQDVSWISWPGPMPRSTWEHCASGARAFSPSTSALKLSRCLAQVWKAYQKTVWLHVSVTTQFFNLRVWWSDIVWMFHVSRRFSNLWFTSGASFRLPLLSLLCVRLTKEVFRCHRPKEPRHCCLHQNRGFYISAVSTAVSTKWSQSLPFLWTSFHVVSRSSLDPQHLAIPREDTSVHIFCPSWK